MQLLDLIREGNLAIVIIFFIPGFISIKVYDLLVPSTTKDTSKRVFDILAYSSINFVILSWPISILFLDRVPGISTFVSVLLTIVVFLVLPCIWPILLVKLHKTSWLSERVLNVHPSGWDYLFSQRKPYWIIVTMKNGRHIGGNFGKNSYAPSFPNEKDIYIEECWRLDKDGSFVKKIENSAGILIPREEISTIELIKGD